jgi:hypothetical protein
LRRREEEDGANEKRRKKKERAKATRPFPTTILSPSSSNPLPLFLFFKVSSTLSLFLLSD